MPQMLKGLNAYNLGEVPDMEMRTSGSWLMAFFLGFTFQVTVPCLRICFHLCDALIALSPPSLP